MSYAGNTYGWYSLWSNWGSGGPDSFNAWVYTNGTTASLLARRMTCPIIQLRSECAVNLASDSEQYRLEPPRRDGWNWNRIQGTVMGMWWSAKSEGWLYTGKQAGFDLDGMLQRITGREYRLRDLANRIVR